MLSCSTELTSVCSVLRVFKKRIKLRDPKTSSGTYREGFWHSPPRKARNRRGAKLPPLHTCSRRSGSQVLR
jgi:hypothetical protein